MSLDMNGTLGYSLNDSFMHISKYFMFCKSSNVAERLESPNIESNSSTIFS